MIANLKKGYLDKFPKEIKEEVLAHCDRIMTDDKAKEKAEPENSPLVVKNLKLYLDQCKDKGGALAQIRKDSFPKMSPADREEIIAYANK